MLTINSTSVENDPLETEPRLLVGNIQRLYNTKYKYTQLYNMIPRWVSCGYSFSDKTLSTINA